MVKHARRFDGWLWLVCLFASYCEIVAQNATVRAALDRESVMVGETTMLRIIVENGTPQSVPSFPRIPGLAIQYRGPAQNAVIINGQASVSVSLLYAVTASEPGEFTIPAVSLRVDNANATTTPLKLRVSRADPKAQNQGAFLVLSVPKEEVYVGEVLPVEIQLYLTRGEDLQPPQLKGDGFVIHKDVEHTRSTSQIGNVPYTVLTFRKTISAVKPGELTLGPAELTLTLTMRASPDPNDIFGEFFGRFQRRRVTLTSSSVKLKALPLPPNAPASFGGAIGQFQWSVNATPTSLNAGDPVTIRATITGLGNLDLVKLPELNWPDFRLYPPTSKTESNDPLGIQGTKTFEVVAIPQHSGVKAIPEMKFSYFDPQQKIYYTLAAAAIPLSVNPAPGGQSIPTVGAGTMTDEEAEDRNDIVHIKVSPGSLAAVTPPLVRMPWFWVLQMIPVVLFLGVAFWRTRQDRLASNPKLRRQLEVEHFMAGSFPRLKELASQNQPEAFYALLFRMLQEQLGATLDLPSSSITEAVVNDYLPARGASAETIELLHKLFQSCNQARYAPQPGNQQLLEMYRNLESVTASLQRLPS